MKTHRSIAALLVCVALAAVSSAGSAAESVEEICSKLPDTLAEQANAEKNAETALRQLLDSGMTLAQATLYAMNCAGEGYAALLAGMGVSLAGNLAQAQLVADAVLAEAGNAASVSEAVNNALQHYVEFMPQPSIHDDRYTPTGPGVSPST